MFYGDQVSETVTLLGKMDNFFDCMNVRSLYENPYTDVEDPPHHLVARRLPWIPAEVGKFSYESFWATFS